MTPSLNSLFGFLSMSTLQDMAYGSEKGLALISGHTDVGDGGGLKWSPHKPLDFEQLLKMTLKEPEFFLRATKKQ